MLIKLSIAKQLGLGHINIEIPKKTYNPYKEELAKFGIDFKYKPAVLPKYKKADDSEETTNE